MSFKSGCCENLAKIAFFISLSRRLSKNPESILIGKDLNCIPSCFPDLLPAAFANSGSFDMSELLSRENCK